MGGGLAAAPTRRGLNPASFFLPYRVLAMLKKTLSVCALVMGALMGWAPTSMAVTLNDDPVPHLWHSFNTPDRAFEGVAGYAGPSWLINDAGALYADWGGFIPTASGSWTFVTPTVGISAGLSVVFKETSRTALLTGVGNIYGLANGMTPGPPMVFNLVMTDSLAATYGTGQVRTVVMRSATKGTLPDMNVLLDGVAAMGSHNTFRVDGTIDMPTGPGGAMEPNVTSDAEWIWVWENVPVASTYQIDFRTLVGHSSLDSLVVYASPPHPAPTQRSAVIMGHALVSQLAQAVEQETLLASAARHLQRFMAQVQDLAGELATSLGGSQA